MQNNAPKINGNPNTQPPGNPKCLSGYVHVGLPDYTHSTPVYAPTKVVANNKTMF